MSYSAAAGRSGVVFAGRKGELAVLRSAWDSARGGSGRVVAVEGVAGVGKRALIEEFLAGVHVPVIRVNGIDVEPPVSWDVVASIIRQSWRTEKAPRFQVISLSQGCTS